MMDLAPFLALSCTIRRCKLWGSRLPVWGSQHPTHAICGRAE